MKTIDQYDDYLRDACGLTYWDGPPVTLTLDQARAALQAIATDIERYHALLARAIRNAKQPESALHPSTSKPA